MKQCDVTLIIPVGKESTIFPWGVHFIQDYLLSIEYVRNVNILNLSDDKDIQSLFDCYKEDLYYLLDVVSTGSRSVFRIDQSYFGVVASLGARFLDIVKTYNFYKPFRNPFRINKVRDQLEKLKTQYDQLIRTKFESCSNNKELPHVVGISTYDFTAFNALYITKLIREVFQPAILTVGGDYWDFKTAWTMIKESDMVDGVVVGYGEQVLAEIAKTILSDSGLQDARQFPIKGFINKYTIENEKLRENIFVLHKEVVAIQDDRKSTQQVFNVPEIYTSANTMPLRLVQRDLADSKIVHVMTQRGCCYGVCQFCTQIDKHLFFEFPIDQVISQLADFFCALPAGEKIEIKIDNDEISEASLVKLIDFLPKVDSQISAVHMWLQVKMVSSVILNALHNAGNASKYFFAVNWESLNPETLKQMGKGHTPLQAIFSSKALVDIGASFRSNYMIWFPKQDLESKKKELYFLRAVSHLAPGNLNLFSYSANNRDNIFKRAEKLGITIKPISADIWIKEVFNIDLAFSFWMYEWRTRISKSVSSIVCRLFEETITRRGNVLFPFYQLVTGVFSRTVGWNAMVSVVRLFYKYGRPPKNNSQDICSLTGNKITRKWTNSGSQHFHTEVELSDQAIAVLRSAYFPVSVKFLYDIVSNEGFVSGVKETLEYLENLGAIARHGDEVLSLVNDKEFWINEKYNKKEYKCFKPEKTIHHCLTTAGAE